MFERYLGKHRPTRVDKAQQFEEDNKLVAKAFKENPQSQTQGDFEKNSFLLWLATTIVTPTASAILYHEVPRLKGLAEIGGILTFGSMVMTFESAWKTRNSAARAAYNLGLKEGEQLHGNDTVL